MELEVKLVRRVRTPGGSRRYGRPIGDVILAPPRLPRGQVIDAEHRLTRRTYLNANGVQITERYDLGEHRDEPLGPNVAVAANIITRIVMNMLARAGSPGHLQAYKALAADTPEGEVLEAVTSILNAIASQNPDRVIDDELVEAVLAALEVEREEKAALDPADLEAFASLALAAGVEVKRRLRRVRTPEGARKYGSPIGTVIDLDAPEFQKPKGGKAPAKPKPKGGGKGTPEQRAEAERRIKLMRPGKPVTPADIDKAVQQVIREGFGEKKPETGGNTGGNTPQATKPKDAPAAAGAATALEPPGKWSPQGSLGQRRAADLQVGETVNFQTMKDGEPATVEGPVEAVAEEVGELSGKPITVVTVNGEQHKLGPDNPVDVMKQAEAPDAPTGGAPEGEPVGAANVNQQAREARGDGDTPMPAGEFPEGDPRNDPEYAAYVEKIDKTIKAALAAGLDTESKNTTRLPDGTRVWTPERSMEHKRLIDRIMEEATAVPAERKAWMMGGLPGAGKSTFLKEHGANVGIESDAKGNPTNAVVINPDEMKTLLLDGVDANGHPYVERVPGLTDGEMASLVHEESSHLANLLAARALADGKNVIFDITLGDGKKAQRKYLTNEHGTGAQDVGYSVAAVFVDGDIPTSLHRAGLRHKQPAEDTGARGMTGRYVPYEYISELAPRDPTMATSDGQPAKSQNRLEYDALVSDGAFDSAFRFDNVTREFTTDVDNGDAPGGFEWEDHDGELTAVTSLNGKEVYARLVDGELVLEDYNTEQEIARTPVEGGKAAASDALREILEELADEEEAKL